MEKFADTRQPTPEVAQLVALVQELQQDFASQKAELEAKIERLEVKLAARPATTVNTVEAEQPPTSRRRMLKKLGLVAANMAAASAAALAVEPNSASAALNTFDFAGTSAGVGNNTATGTTAINASAVSTPILTLSNSSGVGGTPDGLNAFSANGVALQGKTNSTSKSGIVGINASNSAIITAGLGLPAAVVGYADTTVPGALGAGDTSDGVQGASRLRYGVFGRSITQSGGGFMVDANANSTNATVQRGQIYLMPSAYSGVPNTTTALKGEIFLDANGDIYVCTVNGALPPPAEGLPGSFANLAPKRESTNAVSPAPAQWRRLAFATDTIPAGDLKIQFLNKPTRVYDSRSTNNITPVPMSPGQTRIVQVQGAFTPPYDIAPGTPAPPVDIPAGKGVFGNIALVNTLGPNNAYNGGFFTMFSADISYDPSVPFANANIQNVGAPLNNQFLSKSGQSGTNVGKIGVYLGGNANTRCHFIIDITAIVL